jgi:AraC-like DNA-binding protein
MQIQGPPVPITHYQPFTLPVEELHPVIRIAHVQPWPVRVQPRIIYDYELVLILRGRARVTVLGRGEDVTAGDVLWFRPFEAHSIVSYSDEPFGHIAVHFDLAQGFPPIKRSLHNREPYAVTLGDGWDMPRRVRVDCAGTTFGRFSRIVEEWEKGTAVGRLGARVELEQTILELIAMDAQAERAASESPLDEGEKQGSLSARDRARLKRVIQVMQSSLRASVTVRDLAGEAQMSASHFNRLFKRYTGYSPADYLRALRVQKARELLADPGLSIKEVAVLAGFGDPFVFSKTFRRVDGLTPSAYREALLAGRPIVGDRDRK